MLFFDDYNYVIEEYKEFGITENQLKKLEFFLNKFDKFEETPIYLSTYMPYEFIDSPEWAKVMDAAKDVLKAFNYKNPA